jgi:hypothetical protein
VFPPVLFVESDPHLWGRAGVRFSVVLLRLEEKKTRSLLYSSYSVVVVLPAPSSVQVKCSYEMLTAYSRRRGILSLSDSST